MLKILFITPHLSTGGLPQYLLKKIEIFKNQYEIYCIEWNDISNGNYIVQKNKIKEILGYNLITLNDNKENIFTYINIIKPNIIHFEEIPETFIDFFILKKLYDNNRNYNIVCTTHSMYTNFKNLNFLADKFILVSKWSKKQFQTQIFNIPCDIWEYPIEYEEYDKSFFKEKLAFENDYKHVLNVGLFTPGKNQSELIEIARLFDNNNLKVKFHFVGNQAENFKNYWQPLMNNLPSNCVIHGEKDNVSDYYKASDVFYFTSNFELNPICIKEAISYNLKIYAKKLDTYKNQYKNKITFIKNNNLEKNYKDLLNYLNPEKEDFDWGNTSNWYKKNIKKEIFKEKVYEKFFTVENNDIVVDIGASIGPFVKTILEKNPSKVYTLEPSNEEYDLLVKNIPNPNVIHINYGIGDVDSDNIINNNLFVFNDKQTEMKSIKFKTFIKNYIDKKIDFLKTDCEGGEYSIFNEENINWILKNVKKIAGEWHLNNNLTKEKFRNFRNNYLSKFKNYEVYSVDGVNIKWDLWNEHFIQYYNEVIIYIDNR